MGKKDIAEKNLEWHNDIFADIVNAYFTVKGIKKQIIRPEELREARTRTVYINNDELREQERDVVKLWTSQQGRAVFCLVGLENQTNIDTYLPLRIFGYEGGDYRWQLTPRIEDGHRKRRRPYFVVTIVLYFGTKRRWPHRRSLYERLNVPPEFQKVVNDCRVNVFELAWLTDEEEELFKSDFRHVVHYLRQERMKREGEEFDVLPTPIDHAPELLMLMKELTKDRRFENAVQSAQLMKERGEVITMRSFLKEAEDRGIAQGTSRGFSQGIAIGEERGRVEAYRAITDKLIAAGWEPREAAKFTGLAD